MQQLILQLRKIYFGETHFAYALSLNQVAYLYHLMGRYDKAMPLYEQAIAIVKRTAGGRTAFTQALSIVWLIYTNKSEKVKRHYSIQNSSTIIYSDRRACISVRKGVLPPVEFPSTTIFKSPLSICPVILVPFIRATV
ncbi:MAG: tetratricopeptide repeat protein [Flavisolibacter sp.]|nr:tetratricopeptide repeat protein [Flavisolibacter sp.]